MPEETDRAKNEHESQIATFGGGCFWCLDPIFRDLAGVEDLTVGFAGGTVADPSYELVCTGSTGHAEVIQVQFDPSVISFEELLVIFFSFHDPTTLNRQGADVGTQYRSIILAHNEEQRRIAKRVIHKLETEGIRDGAFVTEVVALEHFFPAEEYHQRYFVQNPNQGYCRTVIAPKVGKFRARYADRLRAS